VKGGLAKIWRMISGHRPDVALGTRSRSAKVDEYGPLAPPPPLSYLVDRRPGELKRDPNGKYVTVSWGGGGVTESLNGKVVAKFGTKCGSVGEAPSRLIDHKPPPEC
jgi:hypothetical protein